MAPVGRDDTRTLRPERAAGKCELGEDAADEGFGCGDERARAADLGHVRDLFQRRRRSTPVRSAWRTGEGARENTYDEVGVDALDVDALPARIRIMPLAKDVSRL